SGTNSCTTATPLRSSTSNLRIYSAKFSPCSASRKTPFGCHGRQKFTPNWVFNVRKVGPELDVPIIFKVIEPRWKPHERQTLADRSHRQLDAVLGTAELDMLIRAGRRVTGRRVAGWLKSKKVAATWDGLDESVSFVGQGVPHVLDTLDQRVVQRPRRLRR